MVLLLYCFIAGLYGCYVLLLPNVLKVQVSDTTMIIKDLKLVKKNFNICD